MLLTMRLLHVVLGIFWAGTIVFNALYLQPAMADAGPDGAKVMASLMRRHFLVVMPVVGFVTIVSGLWLYWHVSAGFQADYMGSSTGMAIGVGTIAALAAFAIGVGILRPAMMRAGALSQAAMQAPAPERDAHLATAQALRMRAAIAGRVVAALLTIAAITMAVARYV